MTIDSAWNAAGPAAVLWDMDGTLVESEKLWTIALDDYAALRGGALRERTRADLVGSNMGRSMRLLLADLGVPAEQREVDEAAEWVERRIAELFRQGLTWRPGAREALSALRASGVPTALVTSTARALTEIGLDTIGRERFDVTVCGDEVDGRNKPDPEPYLRACQLLGVPPDACIALEDSPAGVASAVAAGCTVIGIPSEVPLEPGPRRVLRESLWDVDVLALGELLPATGTQPEGTFG